MSTQHTSPALSARSEALLAEFAREPGVTPDHVANLRAAITSSPVLMAELDKALEQGELVALKPLQSPSAGGQYHLQSQKRRFLFPALAASLLAGITTACTATPPPVTETAAMTTPNASTTTTDTQDFPAPQLTPEQMLNRLLDLIAQTQSIEELTFERLVAFFGITSGAWKEDETRYGFAERVSQNWKQGWTAFPHPVTKKKKFRFMFSPAFDETPEMTEVCGVDFGTFAGRLGEMGFNSTPNYVEHGRLMNVNFYNGKIRVEVYPRGEHVWMPEKGSGKACIKMVIIR